jgi:VanZ family protein
MHTPSGLYRILSNRIPALSWTCVIFILLVLPGNMLPNENHMTIPNLDKIVHMILFGSFVFLWSFYFAAKDPKKDKSGNRSLRMLIIACLYGIVMEFVQKYLIPNRDFDLYDIVADVAGSVAGYFVVRKVAGRLERS